MQSGVWDLQPGQGLDTVTEVIPGILSLGEGFQDEDGVQGDAQGDPVAEEVQGDVGLPRRK